MKRICGIFVVLVALTGILFAQEFPCEGNVRGANVNVRTGAGTQFKILTRLNTDDKVTVYEKNGDWLRVQVPCEVILLIHSQFIEKKERETVGIVSGDNVNVRTGLEQDDAVLGQVSKGDKVTIVGEKGNWYKIQPPKGASAWIHSDYVALETTTPPPVKVEPSTPPAPAEDDFEKLKAKYEQIKEAYLEAKAKRDAAEKAKREIEKKLEDAEKRRDEYKKKVEEIEEQQNRALEEWRKAQAKKSKYVAQGWIEDIGRLLQPPPATHKLTRGGQPIYYMERRRLESENGLDDYLLKRVGIKGEIMTRKWKGASIKVICVDEIDILKD